ncbi:intracellular protein transport protein USO1-like [Neltuma alba]|uniref:intracellular protein transport protein USO1-like n=1 Tax=Neltuma alba TaxID=207710 RepID=UPI0010A30729|nr:intracellular protein transport protein USO1-like [Prosopis alba]
MHTMSQLRAVSAPELIPSSSSIAQPGQENIGFEGVATNVKLLLKLIQDHNVGNPKDNLERKHHRVAGMISIIDEVKNRIQKIQTTSKRRAELRRCNTDVKPNIPSPREKKGPELITDEKERLRRELHASLIARQSIQAICSSLGKEKQIMAAELARKAQELSELEDYIIDLKDQNHMLMEKLRSCSLEHRERSSEMEMQGNMALQERNKELSEQLLNVNDGFQSLKKKVIETQEENTQILATMEEMEGEVQAGINKIHGFKGKLATKGEDDLNIKEDISALEHVLESLSLKISKHRQKQTWDH